MSCMKSAVHVRVCGGPEVLVLLAPGIGGRIGHEKVGVGPFFLILLLIFYQGVALVCLTSLSVSKTPKIAYRWTNILCSLLEQQALGCCFGRHDVLNKDPRVEKVHNLPRP